MLGLFRGVVRVPDWPVAAAIASSLAHPEDTFAVCDRYVRAVSPAARRAGIAVGDTRRRALSLCPDLTIVDRDDDRDERMFTPVLDAVGEHVASHFLVRPGLVMFAADPPVATAGSPGALAEQLIGSVTEQALECQVGFACGYLASILASHDDRCIGPERTRGFLAGYPVGSVLLAAPDDRCRRDWAEVVDTLSGLGMSCLGDVAAVDHSDMISRFGRTGSVLWHLCNGADYTSTRRSDRVLEYSVSRHVEEISRAEQVAFLAKGLADELADKLARSMQVASELTVRARFDDRMERSRTWSIDGAGSARDITDRVRWQVSGWLDSDQELGSLIFLELTVSGLDAAGATHVSLFGDGRRAAEQAQRAVLRVQGILGDAGVQSVSIVGSRTPGTVTATENWSTSPARRTPDLPWVGAIPKPWPSIVFPTPPRIELWCRCGSVLYVSADNQLGCTACPDPGPGYLRLATPEEERPDPCFAQAACTYVGRVQVWNYAGPWCVSGRWWDAGGYRRAYLQCDVDGGPPALLYRSGVEWYLEGVYS